MSRFHSYLQIELKYIFSTNFLQPVFPFISFLGFIFVGTESKPYRLGGIYCEQRPSSIFHIDLASGSCKQLSADGMAVCTPRFSPNGHSLIWLENRAFGPHRQCKRLVLIHWKQCKEVHTVIDFIHKAGEEAFPGKKQKIVEKYCCLFQIFIPNHRNGPLKLSFTKNCNVSFIQF